MNNNLGWVTKVLFQLDRRSRIVIRIAKATTEKQQTRG